MTQTLCTTCDRAGRCNKPIDGWDADLLPIRSYDARYKNPHKTRETVSYFVRQCPEYTPDRRARAGR